MVVFHQPPIEPNKDSISLGTDICSLKPPPPSGPPFGGAWVCLYVTVTLVPFVLMRFTAASLKSSCRTYTDSVPVWWPGELLLGQELGVVPVTVNCRTYTDSVPVWWPGSLLIGHERAVVPVTVD